LKDSGNRILVETIRVPVLVHVATERERLSGEAIDPIAQRSHPNAAFTILKNLGELSRIDGGRVGRIVRVADEFRASGVELIKPAHSGTKPNMTRRISYMALAPAEAFSPWE
jgi:hypothetical protein